MSSTKRERHARSEAQLCPRPDGAIGWASAGFGSNARD